MELGWVSMETSVSESMVGISEDKASCTSAKNIVDALLVDKLRLV